MIVFRAESISFFRSMDPCSGVNSLSITFAKGVRQILIDLVGNQTHDASFDELIDR